MSLVSQFLSQIRQHVREQRGDLLASWLQVEPNASQQYHAMAAELRRSLRVAARVRVITHPRGRLRSAAMSGRWRA